MKQLILDYKKWRCGGVSPFLDNRLGKGTTRLYNGDKSHGYCCLGQWALQLTDLKPKDIYYMYYPISLKCEVPLLTLKKAKDSKFSEMAVGINDDPATTISQKIKKLTSLCKKYHYKLVVKNLPKKYQK